MNRIEFTNSTITYNHRDSYEKINQLFEQQDLQDRTIFEAREILGELAKDLADDKIYELINEIQFLVESWIEEYERKVFNGMSLEELLHYNSK